MAPVPVGLPLLAAAPAFAGLPLFAAAPVFAAEPAPLFPPARFSSADSASVPVI